MKLTENPRRPGQVRPIRTDQPCSGVTARFCPRCGTCSCRGIDDPVPGPMSDPGCPLHARDSAHAEPPPLGLTLRSVVDDDALTAA